MQRHGKRADAAEKVIEITMAGRIRQRHKALAGLAELCGTARRLLCLRMSRPERIQARLDASAARLYDGFECSSRPERQGPRRG